MATSFLHGHAVRMERRPVELFRARWLDMGLPADAIDRAAEFEARWGGLVLPPAPWYEGGPRAFSVSVHGGSVEEGWWFWAGDQRSSVLFRFLVGPRGEFALEGAGRKVLLHASVDGWIESVALSYHASMFAGQITKVKGAAVEDLDLSALEPVPLTAGLADTWWRGPDSLVTVYRGEADSFANPVSLRAHLYEGMPEHAFWFG
jgi:hypothetical protein